MLPRKPASPYSLHPAIAYVQAIIDNLPEKTGKSLDEWLRIIKKQKLADEKTCAAWLKQEHLLGGTTAGTIAEHAFGNADDHTADGYLAAAPRYVEEMYAGPKASLKPIRDALLALGRSLGDDVKVCPCQTIVPLYREHVFAQIKPTTRTRIDLGLALKNCPKKTPARLIETGGLVKGDRITHRFAITAIDDIDVEVKTWLKIAYDLDSPRRRSPMP